MITIISPAKTLDFSNKYEGLNLYDPAFISESEAIIHKLRKLSSKKVAKLMNLSKDLADLNVQRYHEWSPNFTDENSRPALLAFGGDVYRGMDNKNFTKEDLDFANDHLRILSGLYGVLKPLDRLQAYRLEMGTSIAIGRKKNLYQFWADKITETLNTALVNAQSDTLVNLASSEYFKAVDFSRIKGKVITPVFKDLKNGEYKVVMTWAKLARGMMTSYIVRNRLTDSEQIKGFEEYSFSEPLSTDSEWVFVRG
jgi:uncharacterized protein